MTLHALMEKYGSDKSTHGYCGFYDRRFGPIRESATAVMEIGVYRGSSIQAWLDYFPNARVYGIDDGAWQKTWDFGTDRAQVFLSEQASRTCMADVLKRINEPLDLILDDGGHTMWGQQASFASLFRGLRPGGLYVIEDLFTSFQNLCIYRTATEITQLYATGADFPLTTTYHVLSNWPDVKSDYMTQVEWNYLVAHVADVEIFDVDGDHKHATAVMEAK